jgi:4-carboxymuconolactone decarboxylase
MSHENDFGTWGRYQELRLDQMTVEQRRIYDHTNEQRGEIPGPYKIWLQNTKLMEVMVPLGVYYQRHSVLSKAEIEIATNLINGKWLASYSNYEHEIIAEELGGLVPEKVEALIAGLAASFEDRRQQVVYDISTALIAPRVIPTGLYRRALDLLGHQGLTDLTVLLGYFTCVSLTLRAYDVPSSAVGLKR